jgi:hypothetical protein
MLYTNEIRRKPKKTWVYPWKYKESFLIAIAFLITGFLIEILSANKAVSIPSWPLNIIILGMYIMLIILFARFIKHPIINWLSTVPAAIASISVFTFLIILMGFIRQDDAHPSKLINISGLNHISSSWTYLLSALLLLTVLAFTIVKRSYPPRLKNLAFFLNHGGLFIVISAASLGSGDLYRLSMPMTEGQIAMYVYDNKDKTYEAPIRALLLDFEIQEYPPDLVLANLNNGKIILNKNEAPLHVEKGKSGQLGDWKINIIEYYSHALLTEKGFIPKKETGAIHAAFVEVRNPKSNEKHEGWISDIALIMADPQVKKYSSYLKILDDSGNLQDFVIEVNKPVNIQGWKVYQQSYDSRMGRDSKVSILELVNDPWLPAVYTGIFMMLLGSLYLFWQGSSRNLSKGK